MCAAEVTFDCWNFQTVIFCVLEHHWKLVWLVETYTSLCFMYSFDTWTDVSCDGNDWLVEMNQASHFHLDMCCQIDCCLTSWNGYFYHSMYLRSCAIIFDELFFFHFYRSQLDLVYIVNLRSKLTALIVRSCWPILVSMTLFEELKCLQNVFN